MCSVALGHVSYDGIDPDTTSSYDFGTSGKKWKDIYLSGSVFVSTMTITGGSITDSSGDISFDDENLTTTGLGTFGNLDVNTLNLNDNSITDSTGTILFDNENLTTTGTGTFGDVIASTGDVNIVTGNLEGSDDFKVGTATTFWNFDDTGPYIWNSTANIGFGTATPTATLNVEGTVIFND